MHLVVLHLAALSTSIAGLRIESWLNNGDHLEDHCIKLVSSEQPW